MTYNEILSNPVLKAYESYKETGNEWLGSLPENWSFAKINYYSTIKTGGTPDKSNLNYWEGGTINWLSSGEINKKIITEVEGKITEEGYENSNAAYLPINSVLIALNGQGRTKGTVALLQTESTCNQSLAAFICDEEKLYHKYLYYFLESKYKEIRGLVGDGKREGLSISLLKSLYTPLPPISEQKMISNYLNKKITNMDLLVTKKESLIKTLQEIRRVLITNAVTKGITPDVEMKHTQVDWLGDIPEHWEIKKLKYTVKLSNEKATEDDFEKPYIGLENVEPKTSRLLLLEKEPDEAESSSNLFDKNEVLFGKLRPYLAKAFVADFQGRCSSEFFVLKCHLLNPSYLKFLLLSDNFLEEVNSSTYGAKMPRASWDFVGNIEIPIPPIKEQEEIVTTVNEKISKIDKLIFKNNLQVETIKEYRQALITAAVTGKIDVRKEAIV
jgi:type I restriction enzyme, S subunit